MEITEQHEFPPVDLSKVPDILKSRANNDRMTKLLGLGKDSWNSDDEEFILSMESAIIDNFTKNYGYTLEQAKKHVEDIRNLRPN